jgi:hypothetical protein
VGAKRAARVEPRGSANDRPNTDPLAEARCLRKGAYRPADIVPVVCRTKVLSICKPTDRLTTTTDLKSIPAPIHAAPPRRKIFVAAVIGQTPPCNQPGIFFLVFNLDHGGGVGSRINLFQMRDRYGGVDAGGIESRVAAELPDDPDDPDVSPVFVCRLSDNVKCEGTGVAHQARCLRPGRLPPRRQRDAAVDCRARVPGIGESPTGFSPRPPTP